MVFLKPSGHGPHVIITQVDGTQMPDGKTRLGSQEHGKAWNEAPMKGKGKICGAERGRRKMRGASSVSEKEESRRHQRNSCLRYVASLSSFPALPSPKHAQKERERATRKAALLDTIYLPDKKKSLTSGHFSQQLFVVKSLQILVKKKKSNMYDHGFMWKMPQEN